MWSDSWTGSGFQIHLLKLSDGRPHPLAPVDQTAFHVGFEGGMGIQGLDALISERRLVVVATLFKPLTWLDHSEILTWDWQNSRRIPVSFLNSVTRRETK